MEKKLVYIVNVDWFFISHRLPLAIHAIEKGWKVYVFTKDTGKKNDLINKGITFVDVPFGRTSINPIQELKCLLRIYKNLKLIKPDIIHNITWKGCLLGGLAAKMVGNHHVINALSGLGSMFIGKGVINQLMGQLAKLTFKDDYSVFIFQNPDDVNWFKGLDYSSEDRIFLIKGSGIDLNDFSYKEATPKDRLRILFPARMLRDKGLLELIDAFKILQPKYYGKIELVLAGSCGDANKTAVSEVELKEKLVDGYISWIGNQKDMYPIYVGSDVVVLPSYREGLPKSLIEACAVGRPIITTDVPGCRECVDEGINGYLVPKESTKELACAIEKLILCPEDRMNFGHASRLKAEKYFSIENVIKSTFSIYDYVLTNIEQ